MKNNQDGALWGWRVRALTAIVAAMLTSPFSYGASDQKVEHDFQRAMDAQDRGDLELAETLLTKLQTTHPDVFAINESLGLVLVARGEISHALPLLEKAAHEQPSSDLAHVNLGAALYQVHRMKPALDEFERAVQINPGNLSAQKSLGRLYMDDRQPDRAANAFFAALQLEPEDPDLRLDSAIALIGADRLVEAQTVLVAVPSAERSARVQSLLADVDEKQGKFQSAAEHLVLAVKLEPNEENAWQLSLEFLRHWNFKAAIAELQAASEKFPESIRIRLGLGAAYFGDEQYGEAISAFTSLLKGDNDNALYAELLGKACNAEMQSTEQQCGDLLKYAEAHPRDTKSETYAASMLMKEANDKKIDEVRDLLKRALAIDPKFALAQYQMGLLKQREGDWMGSIPYLEAAVSEKPGLAQAHYRLALAYRRAGNTEGANVQVALQRESSQQDRHDLDERLNEITTFIVQVQK